MQDSQTIKKRGADGIQGLARNFRICDTNGSGQLDEEELAKVHGKEIAEANHQRPLFL